MVWPTVREQQPDSLCSALKLSEDSATNLGQIWVINKKHCSLVFGLVEFCIPLSIFRTIILTLKETNLILKLIYLYKVSTMAE